MAYRLTIAAPHGPRGMKRAYKKARNEALKSAGEHWRHTILPGHFEASASSKYRYKTRTERYRRRKRKEGRGDRPMVYTGRLRKAMLGKKPSVKAAKQGLTMTWRGLPRYTYIMDTVETNEKGETKIVKRPDKPAELTAMNKADANAVAKVYARGFARRIKKFKGGGR